MKPRSVGLLSITVCTVLVKNGGMVDVVHGVDCVDGVNGGWWIGGLVDGVDSFLTSSYAHVVLQAV